MWECQAYAIKYLKTALDFVKRREEKEREFIIEYYPELDSVTDWQVKLTDWKLEFDVHTITSYQAKRFAKWLKEKVENEM